MKKLIRFFLAVACLMMSMTVLPTKASEIYDIDISVTDNQKQAQDVLKLINEEREKVGVAPLTWSNELENAANLRAAELTAYFSHTRPNNTACFTVSSLASGENISAGYSNADAVMAGWMESPGHRSNILDSNFKSVGVGSVKIGNVPYWVQLFSYKSINDNMQPPKTNSNIRTISMHENYVKRFQLNINDYVLSKGDTVQVHLRIANEGWEGHCVPLADDTLIWESSNSKAVSVNSTGLIKGVGGGNTVIKATHKKYPFITDSAPARCQVALQGIALNNTSIKVAKGSSTKISVKYNPSDASYKPKIKWSVIDTSIAKVDNNGNITGVKEGTTTIYADSEDLIDYSARLVSDHGFTQGQALSYARQVMPEHTTHCSVQVTKHQMLSTPQLYKIESSKGKLTLRWNKVDKATGYNIYRYNAKKNTYERITWSKGTSITLENEPIGVTNNYRIKAYNKDSKRTIASDYSNLQAVKLMGSAKLGNAQQIENGLSLKWNKVGGATGYSVYRYDNKNRKWTYLGATADRSYIDKDVVPGEHYQYKVLPYAVVNKNAYYGVYSNANEGMYMKPTNINVSSVKSSIGKISFSWSKSDGATGYNVYRFNKYTNQWVTVKSVVKGTSFVDTSMPYKGVCYYKIRPYYKTKDGKVLYGKYSTQLGIKSK